MGFCKLFGSLYFNLRKKVTKKKYNNISGICSNHYNFNGYNLTIIYFSLKCMYGARLFSKFLNMNAVQKCMYGNAANWIMLGGNIKL